MNVYDFDDTIYYGNSERHFYFYLLKKDPIIFIYIFNYLFFLIKNLFKKNDINKRREEFYRFLNIYNKSNYKIKFKHINFCNNLNSLDDFNQNLLDNYFYDEFKNLLKKEHNIVDLYVLDFWIINEKRIKPWYFDIKKEDDLIISASPNYLINPICKRLNIRSISTEYDLNQCKYLSKICKNVEKVERYNQLYNDVVENFYSDSMSDEPMMKYAKNGYIVKKDKIFHYH